MARSSATSVRPGYVHTSGRMRELAACVVAAAIAGACGSVTPATVSPSAAVVGPGASATPVASAAPASSADRADTIRIGWQQGTALDGFRGPNLQVALPSLSFTSVAYSALFRFDGRYNPVPDLAAGPCVPQADARVIRCRLVETTFHDGSPLTAEDVAYSERLFDAVLGASGSFDEVRVIDCRTVEFVLSQPDATFVTTMLAAWPIFSKSNVEVFYADFRERSRGLTGKSVQGLVDAINEDLDADPPDCTSRLGEADGLLATFGVHLYREDYRQANGTFDPCAYLAAANGRFPYLVQALDSNGLEAVMGAVIGFLAPFRPLVGTGPYRYVSQTADRVHLEAFTGYHGGPATTRYLDFVPARADGSDLEAGTLDVIQGAELGTAFQATAASQRLRVALPPAQTIFGLLFNVRPGQLFADVSLRRAVQRCIDLPQVVDAATGGRGNPLSAPVLPGTWAAADLPILPRDVPAARQLIEDAGWRSGPDGVYAKGGVRLSAHILVRADDPVPARARAAEMIAFQARDCGMALDLLPRAWSDIQTMMADYPHDVPGTKTPFDLYMWGGALAGPDPDMGLSGFASSSVTDAQHSNENGDHPNIGGYKDPVFDRLVEAARATYDVAERARLSVQAQQELAAMQPVLWLWSGTAYDAVRSAVATVDGPLDLTAPNWAWQPERWIVAAGP